MKKQTKAKGPSFLNSDRAILMICIGIALIFWVLVKLSQSYRTTRDYEIKYTLPQGKTFAQSPLKTVKASLEGKGWDLIFYYFRNKNPRINFDLTEIPSLTVNSNLITIKIKNILPAGIEIKAVNVDFYNLNVQSLAEKKVPIVLKTDLEFAPRFYLMDTITTSADSVDVAGPISIIDSLKEWNTETLVLKNIQASGKYKVALTKPANTQLIPFFNEIEVNMAVEEFTEKDVFVPIVVKNAPDSLKIFPENIKMSFSVGLSDYNHISGADFTVEVDLRDIPLNAEKNTIPVLVTSQPASVKNVNYSPKSVEFFFVETNEIQTSKN